MELDAENRRRRRDEVTNQDLKDLLTDISGKLTRLDERVTRCDERSHEAQNTAKQALVEVGKIKEVMITKETLREELSKIGGAPDAASVVSSASGTRTGASNASTSGHTRQDLKSTPQWARNTVIIGGFERYTDRMDLLHHAKALLGEAQNDVLEYVAYDPGNTVKCHFKDNKTAWKFIREYKNRQPGALYTANGQTLWVAIQKTFEERNKGKVMSRLIKSFEYAIGQDGIFAGDTFKPIMIRKELIFRKRKIASLTDTDDMVTYSQDDWPGWADILAKTAEAYTQAKEKAEIEAKDQLVL